MGITRGSEVICPDGVGVVSDTCQGEALVRLDEGTVLDVTHGQWWPEDALTITGFREGAMVWRGPNMVPAVERNI